MKKKEKLERIRATKFTEETRKSWFALLKSVLTKLDLFDKPAQIFKRRSMKKSTRNWIHGWRKIFDF